MKELIQSLLCKKSCKLLILLLLTDLIFLMFHLLYLGQVVADPLWSIERESGFSEIFQYIKEFWIFIALLMLGFRDRRFIYVAWSGLFLYLLIDDSYALHEKVGNYLTNYVDLKPMLNAKPQDVGELIASGFFGILLFGTLFILYLFSRPVEKLISRQLFLMILALAFFGVFFDIVHVAIHWGENVWGIVEDWGEMLIMSLIVCYAYDLNPAELEIKLADKG